MAIPLTPPATKLLGAKKRLYDFKGSRTISNQKFMNLVKQCEKEFECEIDFIDLTITPKLF